MVAEGRSDGRFWQQLLWLIKSQIILMNQSEQRHVADAKRGKTRASKSQLVLVVLLPFVDKVT